MADFNSSLPIRTENDGDAVIKIADATIPSQQLAVGSDGSINVTDNGGSLTVDAVDLDIRDLAFGTDSVDVSNSTNVAVVDGGGSLTVDAVDLDIRDLQFASDSVDVSGSSNVAVVDGGGSLTVDAVDLDIRDLAFGTDSVDVSGSSNVAVVDGGGSLTVDATDLDIRDLSAAQDSVAAHLFDEAGVAFSASNPLPVSISADISGTEVNDYNTAAAVASAATSNHDYTPGAAFLLTQIEASASSRMKIEVQIETGVATNVFNTRFVKFSSESNLNISIQLKSPISVASGVRVRVIRTNRDNQAQDLYSTISGQEG